MNPDPNFNTCDIPECYDKKEEFVETTFRDQYYKTIFAIIELL